MEGIFFLFPLQRILCAAAVVHAAGAGVTDGLRQWAVNGGGGGTEGYVSVGLVSPALIIKKLRQYYFQRGSAVTAVKKPPAMQGMRVRSLHQEAPLEKEMATHSSIPAWKIPSTEEPGGLQSMGWQRVIYD